MRRISPVFALAALLLAPSSALANQHRVRVSEVLLSTGGDDAAQFVELVEPGAETFPNTYELAVYDVDGNSVDSQAFDPPDGPWTLLLSTAAADAALGVEGDIELTLALPPAGQVCFQVIGGIRIACTSWGCINTVVSGDYDTTEGAAPPDGQSIQRQADNTFETADPTPGEANTAGAAGPACGTEPDAGPGGIDAGNSDADGGPGSPDGGGSGGDGSGGDDDSGCGCRVNGGGGAASCLALGAVSLLCAFRRRRGRA